LNAFVGKYAAGIRRCNQIDAIELRQLVHLICEHRDAECASKLTWPIDQTRRLLRFGRFDTRVRGREEKHAAVEAKAKRDKQGTALPQAYDS